MPSRPYKIPSYRLHKPSGLAVVRLNGRDIYLGKHGTEASQEAYHRHIAEWLASGQNPTKNSVPMSQSYVIDLSINDLILAFWRHAQKHYRQPDGTQGGELSIMRDALRPLRKLYGRTSALNFGPLALRAVQQEMVKSGLCRTTINARINRIRRVFRWAVGVELLPASVHQALQAVPGLQRGRCDAQEPETIKPVPIEHVEASQPFMPRPVAAMVRIQRLTGCRTEDVLTMRGCDLIPGDLTWEYRPEVHKNSWRGQERVVVLGPQAQAIVKEFLTPDLQGFLFKPCDAVEDARARRRATRKTSRTPIELARGRKSKWQVRDRYTRRSYRQAIIRACEKAGAPAWTPLRLRHTRGTEIRARYGLEAAQLVLGHAKADVTQVYAERDLARAHAIMAEIG